MEDRLWPICGRINPVGGKEHTVTTLRSQAIDCTSAIRVPCAVHVITKVMRSTEQTVQPGGDNILRQREHSLLPEFTSPELDKDPKTAVAGVDPQWVWRGRETMHPFWAVRRMTAKQMSVAQDKFANDTQQNPTKHCQSNAGVMQGTWPVVTQVV